MKIFNYISLLIILAMGSCGLCSEERDPYYVDHSPRRDIELYDETTQQTISTSPTGNVNNDIKMLRDTDKSLKLKKRLAYLLDLEDIEWVCVDDNTVYIGFTQRPEDMKTVCNAAAYMGNKEIDFGCHVFAVDASKYQADNIYDWVNTSWKYMYEVTYRHGRKK